MLIIPTFFRLNLIVLYQEWRDHPWDLQRYTTLIQTEQCTSQNACILSGNGAQREAPQLTPASILRIRSMALHAGINGAAVNAFYNVYGIDTSPFYSRSLRSNDWSPLSINTYKWFHAVINRNMEGLFSLGEDCAPLVLMDRSTFWNCWMVGILKQDNRTEGIQVSEFLKTVPGPRVWAPNELPQERMWVLLHGFSWALHPELILAGRKGEPNCLCENGMFLAIQAVGNKLHQMCHSKCIHSISASASFKILSTDLDDWNESQAISCRNIRPWSSTQQLFDISLKK